MSPLTKLLIAFGRIFSFVFIGYVVSERFGSDIGIATALAIWTIMPREEMK